MSGSVSELHPAQGRPYDQDADKAVGEPSWLSLAIVGAFLLWLVLMFVALTVIVVAFAWAAISDLL